MVMTRMKPLVTAPPLMLFPCCLYRLICTQKEETDKKVKLWFLSRPARRRSKTLPSMETVLDWTALLSFSLEPA